MKWIGRILFGFAAIMIGLTFHRSNTMKKHFTYYDENVYKFLEENKSDSKKSYIDGVFTTLSVEKYITEPVYNLSSNDEKFPFELSFYHILHGANQQSVIMYFDDRELGNNDNKIDFNNKDIIYDVELVEKYAAYVIEVYYDGEEKPLEYAFSTTMKNRLPGLLFNISEEGKFSFNVADGNKTVVKEADKIDRINIHIEDRTGTNGLDEDKESGRKPVRTDLVSINHSDDATNSSNDVVSKNEDNKLYTDNFNGLASNFNLRSKYEDTSLVSIVNADLLKPYNKIIVNGLIYYSLGLIVVTYLMFFLKPTINYFQDKKYAKQRALKLAEKEELKE